MKATAWSTKDLSFSATYLLCDLGQLSQPSQTSVSASVKPYHNRAALKIKYNDTCRIRKTGGQYNRKGLRSMDNYYYSYESHSSPKAHHAGAWFLSLDTTAISLFGGRSSAL